jgi:hypothetical protein
MFQPQTSQATPPPTQEAQEAQAPAIREDNPKAQGPRKLSHKHEAILQAVLSNPEAKLKTIAQHFNVSQSWLSCVIHSDAFQARMAECKEEIFHASLLPIKHRVETVAGLALDRLTEGLELNTLSAEETRKTAEMSLRALGFGAKESKPPGPLLAVGVNLTVDSALLAEARSRVGQKVYQLLENSEASEAQEPLEGECVHEENTASSAQTFSSGGNGRVG